MLMVDLDEVELDESKRSRGGEPDEEKEEFRPV